MKVITGSNNSSAGDEALRTETEYVMRVTQTKPSECACDYCKSRCTITPGIGLPEEMTRIIQAGYGDKVSRVTWLAGMFIGMPPVEMIGPKVVPDHGCAFLLPDGRCELHDKGLKPLECRLTSHNPASNVAGLTAPAIAKVWMVYHERGLIQFQNEK